jgi:Cytochrome c/Fe2+ transport protein
MKRPLTRLTWLLVGLGAVAAAALWGAHAGAQQTQGHVHAPSPSAPTPAGAARRVTMDELHRHGGVPRGWTFGLPPGDAARGRELFRELECYKCHEIKAEKFPAPADGKYTGPALTGMGRMHPAEYIAESILFPNAVIVDEPGHTGPDGLSLMPSYADSLSVTQWLDLVAYLKSLTEGGEHAEGHGIERVATAGDYRIRLVYADGGHHGAGPGAHHGAAGPRAAGHLMAFITAVQTGEAVPYLPVTATVQASGAARRTITLRPMLSDGGFHYGADVALSRQTRTLTLVVGPTTMRVAGSAKGRFAKPATAVFDWGAPSK